MRQRTALFRGALLGTILRDDGYFFSQLGAFVERADNTARILDVKYFILLPANQMIGGEIDTYQWETILRSVSAHRSYHHVFHENYRPWNVADFLILRAAMPRSLRFCYDWLQAAVDGLSAPLRRRGCPPASSSPRRATCCMTTDMKTIFQGGLHEFLTDFIDRNNRRHRSRRGRLQFRLIRCSSRSATPRTTATTRSAPSRCSGCG